MTKFTTFLIIVLLIIGFYSYGVIQHVSRNPLGEYGSVILRDKNNTVITKKGLPGGYMIPYTGTLSGELFEAIIAIEDRRYYEHNGVDIYGKLGSIRENIEAGSIVRGGSTITEQYIKNTFYRGKPRTIQQKIDEAIAALWIEITKTKEEILRGYLDNIYFGNNIYGLAGALEVYHGSQDVSSLSHADIIDILTRIHSPNIKKADTEKNYRSTITKKLSWSIDSTRIGNPVKRESIDIYPIVTRRVLEAIDIYCRRGDGDVLKKWTKNKDISLCSNNQIHLTLTLDGNLQSYAQTLLRKTVTEIQKKNATAGAIYIYDPTEDSILAYIGNHELSSSDGEIDMIERKRSVGSILKPFIYLLALRDGAELENLILDDSRTYPTGIDGKVFVPQNYNPISYGPVRLREALGNSLNSSTVRITEKIGIGRVYNFFKELGLDLDHDASYYGYGISLGVVELSLKNIVESYRYMIRTDDKDIYLIEKALRDEKNRAMTFGVSSILGTSIQLPVKTGTSTDFRDNWVVSYHRDAIIGVWVGNTDATPMGDVSGVTGAGPIWHSIAEYMIDRRILRYDDDSIPTGVTETFSCIDMHCLQQERVVLKNTTLQKSRPKNGIYYKADFYGNMTEDEIKKWGIQ